MVATNLTPAAVRERDQRSVGTPRECNFYFRLLVRREIDALPFKDKPSRWLPDGDFARFNFTGARFGFYGLEQTTADSRFNSHYTGALARCSELYATPPPLVDFFRKDFECPFRIDSDQHCDTYLVAIRAAGLGSNGFTHLRVPRDDVSFPLCSACCLNA